MHEHRHGAPKLLRVFVEDLPLIQTDNTPFRIVLPLANQLVWFYISVHLKYKTFDLHYYSFLKAKLCNHGVMYSVTLSTGTVLK